MTRTDHLLLPLLLFECIIAIMAIMTLLWPLWLFDKIMTLMTFRVYYCHYYNSAIITPSTIIAMIIAIIAIIAIIYFCANRPPKVVKRGRIPGLTGGKHSYIMIELEQAAIAAKIL